MICVFTIFEVVTNPIHGGTNHEKEIMENYVALYIYVIYVKETSFLDQ